MTTDFDRRLTMGFKLLSGFYEGAISKPSLESLGSNQNVEWSEPRFEILVREVDTALQKIGMFNIWRSWRVSLANMASDAVAMNFLLLVTKDWEAKEKPNAAGAPRDRFQKNARILLDRMVYEYVVGRWRGSGDSRIARNLEQQPTDKDAVFEPIPMGDWDKLIAEVVDEGTIAGDDHTGGVSAGIKLLLLYFYCLKGVTGPDKPFDVEHIIPQRRFNSLTAEEKSAYGRLMNNISNLAFLPRGDNIAKRDRTLCDLEKIDDPVDEREWLLGQVTKFTDIPRERMKDYCNAAASLTLREARGQEIKHAFGQTRLSMLGLLS